MAFNFSAQPTSAFAPQPTARGNTIQLNTGNSTLAAQPISRSIPTFGVKPSMSSFATQKIDAQLEPKSLFDNLLVRLAPYKQPAKELLRELQIHDSFAEPQLPSRFSSSFQTQPALHAIQKSDKVMLKLSSEHGSVEFIDPLTVKELPDDLDTIIMIQPGQVTVNVPNACICTLSNIAAEGSNTTERASYMAQLSIQNGVEFVQYFDESGLWVFRK
ncbi:hypothetical protein SS50377_21767 [Spironucleus salmonicida]|uniref:Uncharacterized protein n=1 Tax=Spironucleus salmonicida TaxID=348837 RepID=A0A9P8LXR7_9EUKA|nr:hypothetical protein SS50377_21767 [Spironucleus salmonicida]